MEDQIDKNPSKEYESNTVSLTEWLVYYQILIEDTKYAKQQQWRLAYYTLSLLGAITALSKYLKPALSATIVLFIVALSLAVSGTYYLRKFQRDLRRYGENIKNVRDKLPQDLQEIVRYKPAEEAPTYNKIFSTCLLESFGQE